MSSLCYRCQYQIIKAWKKPRTETPTYVSISTYVMSSIIGMETGVCHLLIISLAAQSSFGYMHPTAATYGCMMLFVSYTDEEQHMFRSSMLVLNT